MTQAMDFDPTAYSLFVDHFIPLSNMARRKFGKPFSTAFVYTADVAIVLASAQRYQRQLELDRLSHTLDVLQGEFLKDSLEYRIAVASGSIPAPTGNLSPEDELIYKVRMAIWSASMKDITSLVWKDILTTLLIILNGDVDTTAFAVFSLVKYIRKEVFHGR